jgi:hypothetical protein
VALLYHGLELPTLIALAPPEPHAALLELAGSAFGCSTSSDCPSWATI